MNPFWLVWNPVGGPPTYKHPSLESAKAEAERLARLYPGQSFFVLGTRGVARKVESAWSDLEAFDLPF